MKKNKALIVLLICLFVFGVVTVTYRLLLDENKLTLTEKKYIQDSKSNLINVNVSNNLNVFGLAGKGVFYDFLADFESSRGLNFNKIAVQSGADMSGLSLRNGDNVPTNAIQMYTDHYVLVGKTFAKIKSISDISGNIGILSKSSENISKITNQYQLTITNYEDRSSLENALNTDRVNYILVPRLEYLDTILGNLYSIVYHFTDIKNYYFITPSNNKYLDSILKKHFNIWSSENFNNSFNKNEYDIFINKLKITEKELDVINRKEYTYGFVNDAPYNIKSSGGFGGIFSEYLKSFSDFSGIEFKYKNYKNANKLKEAANKKKIDLYSNLYKFDSDFVELESLYNLEFSIVMRNDDNRTFKNLEALRTENIYVLENSLVEKNLKDQGFRTSAYKSSSALNKLLKDNNIVAVDTNTYKIYSRRNANVDERFKVATTMYYNFFSNNDTMFNRLFTYYISSIDKEEVIHSGINSYNVTLKSGKIIYKITEYAIILILIIAIIYYIFYKFSKKIRIKKKIKKADKMKYIDMLTSLKNRNFLNESLPMWNQNTIYPQAVILIDLNSLQELNDTYGYLEGDKQIQSMANILIKTQLDNTEIMRTDGNEFTVYMVGYSEKQVLSYIKKLNKEIKNLPHEKGAAIGFSMIDSDLKLIDDAINEATENMKKNKELMQGAKNEE